MVKSEKTNRTQRIVKLKHFFGCIKKQSYLISCGGILLPDNYGKLTSQILFDQSAINL